MCACADKQDDAVDKVYEDSKKLYNCNYNDDCSLKNLTHHHCQLHVSVTPGSRQ